MNEIAEIIAGSIPQLSAAALFAVLFFGTFVSEDAACLAAGAAAANSQIGVAAAIAACFLGIFAGDMLLYAAGWAMGERVFENRLVRRFVSAETKAKAARWLETNGATAVFLSRFATGLRLPTYLAAGAFRTDVRKFALYFLLASAIWTPLLVGSVAFSQAVVFRENVLLGLVATFIMVRLVIKYSSWKNRRMFIGRLKRIANWEFWPIQIFYAPVVAYVLWLTVRHRGLTFTAVNPSIPAGGFKGESKDEIYKLIRNTPAHVLPYAVITEGKTHRERLAIVWDFMDRNHLSFPVVVKPDAGERGKGVRIVRSYDELTEAVMTDTRSLILQQYAGGEEVSIFYHRRPSEAHGHIFSITEKQFPAVCGDGRSTVEQLILSHPRAVALAAKYLDHNGKQLDRVPEQGETVKLIDIGTHSRGAIFVDGERHRTPELESQIGEICRSIDGFYFGRFDIRVPSFDDLQKGENLKIIELNGVTSESTNIYDPKYSLLDAYRILFLQWRLAFEIGAENIRLGAKQHGIISLARVAFG
ncbi:MAG: VTT domain-containing protein [Pyrinomonadaceae bacterium]